MVFGCITFGFLLSGSAGAASSGDLSTKVLTQVPIPGLTPTAPGPTNGPIGPSNISFFGGKAGVVAQQIASGGLIGYVRAFTHDPPNGQAVVIEGDWVRDQSNIPAILAGIEGGAKGPRFNVPGIVDAIGFETTSATTTETQYAVAFAARKLSLPYAGGIGRRVHRQEFGRVRRRRAGRNNSRRPNCCGHGVEQLKHLLQGWRDLWRSLPGGSDHRWTCHRYSKECRRQKHSAAAAAGVGYMACSKRIDPGAGRLASNRPELQRAVLLGRRRMDGEPSMECWCWLERESADSAE